MQTDFVHIRAKRADRNKLEFIAKFYKLPGRMAEANRMLIEAELKRIKRKYPDVVIPE